MRPSALLSLAFLLAFVVDDALSIFTLGAATITISSGTAAAVLGGLGALKLGEWTVVFGN